VLNFVVGRLLQSTKTVPLPAALYISDLVSSQKLKAKNKRHPDVELNTLRRIFKFILLIKFFQRGPNWCADWFKNVLINIFLLLFKIFTSKCPSEGNFLPSGNAAVAVR
jgi:hypothetical protein